MKRRKHKRKKNHVIIVTSDAVDANVKQLRIRPWLLQLVIIVFCVIVGVVIGLFLYENEVWKAANQKTAAQKEVVAQLEEQKKALESEVESLNNKINILSETVNQKTQTENELSAQLEKQNTPTEFPLTGSASYEEIAEGDPMCVFKAAVGITVVATGGGIVSAVNDDGEYGHCVWIDHGNGYVTIYRNQGDVLVNQGDKVAQGTTLYVIGEENTTLGYQMMKDGAYINPMDMLAISG